MKIAALAIRHSVVAICSLVAVPAGFAGDERVGTPDKPPQASRIVAEEAAEESRPEVWFSLHELPWSSARQSLADRGIVVEAVYFADFFTNARGGFNTTDAFQYRGLFDISLTLETCPMGLWEGGTFFIDFLDNHGIDMTERFVGDLQVVNNADAPDSSRIYEVWYEQWLLNETVRLKLGKMDANADFDGGLFRDEFIHSSPGFSPTMPLVSYPFTAWGAVVFIHPSDWFYAGAGVYDALGTSTHAGFDTAFHAPGIAFSIAEVGLRPTFQLADGRTLAGQYAVGGWHQGGEWPLILDNEEDDDLEFESGNAGLYLAFDQLVYREPPAESEDGEEGPAATLAEEDAIQGLGLFFQFAWSPSDRNEITQHWGAGFQYYGPLIGRDDDICGVGVHHVSLSGRIQALEERYSETAIELFYKAQITDWLSLKPDFQYIINPGGAGRDSIVAGVRLEFAL